MDFGSSLGARREVVQKRARYLQLELWNRREELWPTATPQMPLDVLHPGVALTLRGFSIESQDFIGNEWNRGVHVEVAGLVDRREKRVFISSRYPTAVQKFTAAHELGHVVLHPNMPVMHRDLPLDGPGHQRSWEEREADWFASQFLMPEKQLRLQFAERFGEGPFYLNDSTAFALFATSLDRVMRRCRSARDLARMLAEAGMFCGLPIIPLATRFGVSTTSMAIRLNELDLVAL